MGDNSQPSDNLVLGRQKMKEFMGEEHLKSIQASIKDDLFTKTSMEFISEVCFSGYARAGLEFRERALMNIAMLIALGRGPELRIHIRAAAYNGLTKEQICEACRHAMVYCGVPAGRDAFFIASEVFEKLEQGSQ